VSVSPPSLICLRSRFFDSLDDHFFDALTARTCNDHPLPCSDVSSSCVSEADAASVFALGDFEYECVFPSFPCPLPPLTTHSYIWHAAQNSSTYTSLTFGCALSRLSLVFWDLTRRTQAHSSRNSRTRSPHLRFRIVLRFTWGTTARWCVCSPGWAPSHYVGRHSAPKSSLRSVCLTASEVCFDMYESIGHRCGRMSVCASYACFMRARYLAGWNGCCWMSLWAG
jgi:hypothetical protein